LYAVLKENGNAHWVRCIFLHGRGMLAIPRLMLKNDYIYKRCYIAYWQRLMVNSTPYCGVLKLLGISFVGLVEREPGEILSKAVYDFRPQSVG